MDPVVELMVMLMGVALGFLTRHMAEDRGRRPPARRRRFPSPPRPPGIDALPLTPCHQDALDLEDGIRWRARVFASMESWPRPLMLRGYVQLTHQLDRTVGLLARFHRDQPYTPREILFWPAVDAREMESREAALGWRLNTPN